MRNQFGGSLGGPIIKDKTFWYGSGELHRVRQSAPVAVTSTTQEFLDFVESGAFQQFQESDPNGLCQVVLGGTCPGAFPLSSTLGPIFSTLKANPAMHYPVGSGTNCASGGDCAARGFWTGAFGVTYPVPAYQDITVRVPNAQNEARWTLKVDHRFSDKDSISGTYLFQDATNFISYGGGANTIGPDAIQDGRAQTLALTWNHTFSPNLLNTFKAGYLRHRFDFPAPPGTFGIPGYYTIDGVGVDMGLTPGLPQFFTDNQFQYLDTMSLVHGKHSLKFGGEFRRTRNGSSFFNDAFQFALPWSVEDTLTDLAFDDEVEELLYGPGVHYYGGAYYVSASADLTTGQQPVFYRGYRANEIAMFVQDDWRVTNRLTVNVGLRYEYFGPPHNFQTGIDSNFYFGQTVTPITCLDTFQIPPVPIDCALQNQFLPRDNGFYAGVATGRFQIRDQEIWNKDTNNFSPRAGFAWDLFGNQKLVLRGGFGLMYDRIYNNVFENIRFNPPFFADFQVGTLKNGVPPGPLSTPGLFTYPFTSRANYLLTTPLANPRHMDQNILTPYYEQFHFGFQWEFLKGYVLEPEYVGTLGHKLIGLSDINTFNGRVAFGSACNNPIDITPPFATSNVGCRPSSAIGADNFRGNGYDSNYHALQVNVKKAYSSGVTFNANYTWSKTLDDVSDLFNNASALRPTDNMNHKVDYGPADFDTRHRFVTTVSYDLPFMKDNRFLGGWGLNTIFFWQTGHPWSPFGGNPGGSGPDRNKDGYRTDRVVPVNGRIEFNNDHPADGTIPGGAAAFDWNPATPGVIVANSDFFQCPASVNGGLWCNVPTKRNSYFGPGAVNVDFNVNKKFKLTEQFALTFQANFFDLFNHVNFLNPTAGVVGSSSVQASDFSQSRSTWGDGAGHRVIQLALRLDF